MAACLLMAACSGTSSEEDSQSDWSAVVTADPAQYNFEGSIQGWAAGGTGLSPTNAIAESAVTPFAGQGDLAVNFSTTAGTATVAVASPGVLPGSLITFHVRCASLANIQWLQPFAQQGASGQWAWTGGWYPASSLTAGVWNTVSMTTPANAPAPAVIGVQFQTTKSSAASSCLIDSVSWPAGAGAPDGGSSGTGMADSGASADASGGHLPAPDASAPDASLLIDASGPDASALDASRPVDASAHDASPVDASPLGDASGPALGTMPLLSRGLPIYADYAESPASNAVDADYGTVWRSGHVPSASDPDTLAIDLSGVPATQLTTVYSVWFNESGYDYDTTVNGQSYTLPGNFQIQSNTAAGGASPPATGWVPLVTQSANTLSSGAQIFSLTGARWVRFVSTATASNAGAGNLDTSLQWELFDAHAYVDGWKFLGDSITANSMGHVASGDAFDQLLAKSTSRFPAFEMGGNGGWSSATFLGAIDAYLANFPGRFVGLSLGTNDAGGDPATYASNMSQLIDKVRAAGKVPVLPTIPYTGDSGHSGIPALNAQIQLLYTKYGTGLVPGPDLYATLYAGRATMFDQPTDLHPNSAGDAAIRQAWATAMENVH